MVINQYLVNNGIDRKKRDFNLFALMVALQEAFLADDSGHPKSTVKL